MKIPKVEITVRSEFSAAHRLHAKGLSDKENAKLFGPCNNKNGHGHNYDLFVTVRGPVDPVTGMVMNLFDLHRIVRDHIFDVVDHKHLDEDLDILGGRTSTAENLAVVFWGIVAEHLREFPGVALAKIRIHESRGNIVEYFGE
jgi:6-pyruvoyltetrahydropterin/6-carboxytetrahydropterin synthase